MEGESIRLGGKGDALIALSASDEAIQTSRTALWIASRSLSSGARSRDPLARNDGEIYPPSFRDGAPAPDLRCAIAHRGISRFRVRCFASPRNDGVERGGADSFFQTHLRIPAARFARGLQNSFTLIEIRGRREDRVRAAPAVSRAK